MLHESLFTHTCQPGERTRVLMVRPIHLLDVSRPMMRCGLPTDRCSLPQHLRIEMDEVESAFGKLTHFKEIVCEPKVQVPAGGAPLGQRRAADHVHRRVSSECAVPPSIAHNPHLGRKPHLRVGDAARASESRNAAA